MTDDEMSVDNRSVVDEISVDKMTVDVVPCQNDSVDKMTVDEAFRVKMTMYTK